MTVSNPRVLALIMSLVRQSFGHESHSRAIHTKTRAHSRLVSILIERSTDRPRESPSTRRPRGEICYYYYCTMYIYYTLLYMYRGTKRVTCRIPNTDARVWHIRICLLTKFCRSNDQGWALTSWKVAE